MIYQEYFKCGLSQAELTISEVWNPIYPSLSY